MQPSFKEFSTTFIICLPRSAAGSQPVDLFQVCNKSENLCAVDLLIFLVKCSGQKCFQSQMKSHKYDVVLDQLSSVSPAK